MSHLIFCRLYSGASCAFFRVKYLIERKLCHYYQNIGKNSHSRGKAGKVFSRVPRYHLLDESGKCLGCPLISRGAQSTSICQVDQTEIKKLIPVALEFHILSLYIRIVAFDKATHHTSHPKKMILCYLEREEGFSERPETLLHPHLVSGQQVKMSTFSTPKPSFHLVGNLTRAKEVPDLLQLGCSGSSGPQEDHANGCGDAQGGKEDVAIVCFIQFF